MTFCISGLSAEQPTERRPVGDVPRRLVEGVAHERGRAEHAVEPRRGDHLDDRAHAAPLVAEPHPERAVELELGRGVGTVAELVLQPGDVESVAGAVGQRPRHQEAGQPLRRLRQHQEDVVHRGRGEPLVPVQRVLAVDAGRRAPRVTLARTSDPPCFSVIPMPARAPRFSATGRRPGSYDVEASAGIHSQASRVVHPQRRHGGVRHRDRAAVRRVGVRPGHEPGSAAYVGVHGPAVLLHPRRGLETVTDGSLHQPVPGRVEDHLVDPVAVAVVRRELRLVAVGQDAVLPGLGGAGRGAEGHEVLDDLGAGMAGDRVDERGVGRDDVVADQWRRLVGGCPVRCRHVVTVGPCPKPSRRALRWVRPTSPSTGSPGPPG